MTEWVLDLLRSGSECYRFNSDPFPTQSPFPPSILTSLNLCLNSSSVCWISVPTWPCRLLWHCPTGASQGAQCWRIHLPAQETQETRVWSLGLKDPWRRKWQPTPVFFLGKSYGQKSLARYSPWGHKELDMTEQLSTWSKKFCFFPVFQNVIIIDYLSQFKQYFCFLGKPTSTGNTIKINTFCWFDLHQLKLISGDEDNL